MYTRTFYGGGNTMRYLVEGSWTPDNPDAKYPRLTASYNANDAWTSSWWVRDGSYVRLKNIALGYTFPKKLISKFKIENLRLYANIQNLLTITGYDGYDPEVGASTSDSTGYTYGVDNGRYPSPTTFSFGMNITF